MEQIEGRSKRLAVSCKYLGLGQHVVDKALGHAVIDEVKKTKFLAGFIQN